VSEILQPDPAELESLLMARMPFGKYKGRRLVDLPEAYLTWFSSTGFPSGKLGRELRQVYELVQNGLGDWLRVQAGPDR
jgi:uncharacterized protein